MSKLISTYARATGLKIGNPLVQKSFYPLPFTRYITIQSGSNQPAKNYDYFNEVLNLIRPMLAAAKISIVHVGSASDPALVGVHDLRDKTSFHQVNYIINNSLCHVGTDSLLAHCAGWNKRPLVAMFGSTSIANHGPYWFDPDKTVLLESHRGGGVPSYTLNEAPKTINWITPESIANAVLRLLDIQHQFTHESRFFGPIYQQGVLELVPNMVPASNFIPELPISVRLDYLHNEDILVQLLQTGRKVNIVTTRPINVAILNTFRSLILSYHHEFGVTGAELPSLDYVGTVKTLCPRHVFFTRLTDVKTVADLRFQYIDVCTIDQLKDYSRDDYIGAALEYLNRPNTLENRLDLESELRDTKGKLKFRSTKYLLSEAKVYPSLAHHQANLAIDSLDNNGGDVIDSPSFFRDANYTTIYYEPK